MAKRLRKGNGVREVPFLNQLLIGAIFDETLEPFSSRARVSVSPLRTANAIWAIRFDSSPTAVSSRRARRLTGRRSPAWRGTRHRRSPGRRRRRNRWRREGHDVNGRFGVQAALTGCLPGPGCHFNPAERHGDVFAAEAEVASGDFCRVTFAHHHAAADFQIWHEVYLRGCR